MKKAASGGKKAVERTPRYEGKLEEILHHSAGVFASKGFHNASVRDISRATGISLAGLYYYFKTKEELLFLILDAAFSQVLEKLEESIDRYQGADRLRFFVENHLRYFVENLDEMKVASHESDSLKGDYRRRIEKKKRAYFERLVEILSQLSPGSRPRDVKLAALSLFGMINWIYTWYRPAKDRSIRAVARQMSAIFLDGFLRH